MKTKMMRWVDAIFCCCLKFNNFDFQDDGNEEDDEDDEPDVKVKPTNVKALGDWPQAPQFIDASSAPATSKQVETLSTRMNQMIGKMIKLFSN